MVVRASNRRQTRVRRSSPRVDQKLYTHVVHEVEARDLGEHAAKNGCPPIEPEQAPAHPAHADPSLPHPEPHLYEQKVLELEAHHPKGYLEHAEEKHRDKPHLKMGSPRRAAEDQQ